MQALLDAISEVQTPVILGGDLNTYELLPKENFGWDSELLKTLAHEGFDLSGNDRKGTFAIMHLLRFRLDWLAVRSGLNRVDFRPIHATTLDQLGRDLPLSDHVPISFEIQMSTQWEKNNQQKIPSD
jgi:hypothetical protein